MGNCCSISLTSDDKNKVLPIDAIFNFPNPLPDWPPGDGFASGYIDLGGLQVSQITSFSKIWATYEGGPDNLGATFYEPTSIPDGFFMLGCYSQPNNQPFFGWVLVAKDNSTAATGTILAQPIDYTLVWSSESLDISQDGPEGYVWLPIPPENYKALGHVVTTTPEKPSLDKVRCVLSDFTDECDAENWIWGLGTDSNSSQDGFNLYSSRPQIRGTQAQGVSVGTFAAIGGAQNGTETSSISIACLKNNNFNASSMPNLAQIEALVQAYSPWIYFHPNETHFPSSVNWFFSNGALLYQQGEESNPEPIEPEGANLPQGGSDDGLYWLDLPIDENAKEMVKKGDLQSSEAYLHIKPMLGGTYTDIAVWVFYPFNGASTAKLGLIDIPLGRIGEHIGDWEHITLRISNFNGVLYKCYFSQHSGGSWVDAPSLEFQNGNKVVAYSSLNGHAAYPNPGLVLQGIGDVGIRNDTAKSDMVVDTGARFSVVSVENLFPSVVEPPWLNYFRKWGPKITYELGVEVEKLADLLTGDLKSMFESLVDALPDEIFGEDGPTGPKVKDNWTGDERV